jgi:hypothetical protein
MSFTEKEFHAFMAADKALNVINTYKRTIGVPETPFTAERFASQVAGVLDVWDNPTRTPEDNHNAWIERMQSNGWVYGDVVDEEKKTHPALCDYNLVPELYKANDVIFLAIVKHFNPNK